MPYSITITQPLHATLAVLDAAGDPVSELDAGSVAVVDAEADAGYVVQSLSVTAGGQAVAMEGSAFAMPEADVVVTATVVEEGGDVPPSPADKAALVSAIEAATNDGEETHVSADGEDVYTTDWWALQADVDALYAVVAAALKTADDDAATQADADAQEAAVEAAHTAFLAARSHGSLVPPEQVPDPAGEPATDGDPSNLYRWTQRFDGTLDEWLLPGGTWEDAPSSTVGGFGVASLAVLPFQEVGLAAGESYTLSWGEKAKRTPTVLSDGTVAETSTGVSEAADADGFYRAWATFSMSSAGTWATVQLASATQVRALKFEQGTAATDWTAHPADVDTRDLDNTDPPDPDIVGPSDDTDVPSPDAAVPVDPDDLPIVPVPEIDPETEVVELSLEAMAAAAADNQHFWTRASAPSPDDGAGTGAFVTDEAQESFLEAMAQDVQPTQARPLHNLLMNSLGILLRSAKRVLAQFTPSGVAFYDGEGNAAGNVVAQFGKSLARIGKAAGTHVDISRNVIRFTDGDENQDTVVIRSTPALSQSAIELDGGNGQLLTAHGGSTTTTYLRGFFGKHPDDDNSNSQVVVEARSEQAVGETAQLTISSPSVDEEGIAHDGQARLDCGSTGITVYNGRISASLASSAVGYDALVIADESDGFYAKGVHVLDDLHLPTQDSNTVLAAPDGEDGAPAFRNLTASDIPDLSSTYLPLSGGTMTGEIVSSGARHAMRSTNLDRDGSVSADTWGNAELRFQDKDGERIGLINVRQLADGRIQMWIAPRNEDASGSEVGSGLSIFSAKDGTVDYLVSYPAAFRSAIGLDPQKTGANADTAWVSNATDSNFFVAKSGNSAVLRIGGVKLAQELPHGSNKTVGTLPDGYKAYCPINGVLFNLSSGVVGMVSVSGSNVIFRNTTGATIAANTELYGSVGYLTA